MTEREREIRERVEELPEPTTPDGIAVRALAEAAMSVTHHDIDHSEPEAIHEIQSMERKFRPILLRYAAGRVRLTNSQLAAARERNEALERALLNLPTAFEREHSPVRKYPGVSVGAWLVQAARAALAAGETTHELSR